jgi:hypothetical protein
MSSAIGAENMGKIFVLRFNTLAQTLTSVNSRVRQKIQHLLSCEQTGGAHPEIVSAVFPGWFLLVPLKVPIFSRHILSDQFSMSSKNKLRILIVVALLVGWVIVFFLRSGTSWG